jgi:16S rRNA (guanine527-N7)-methyltransferase
MNELARYLDSLQRANATVNLVSRRLSREELERHVAESLEALPLLPPPRTDRGLRLLDLGSGGGLPAIPLLLVRRDIHGVLVEATGKKCRFLESAIAEAGLTAEVVNARFPAAFPMQRHRPFDLLTSRAVADAGEMIRAARPVLARGATALLWTTEELGEAAAKVAAVHSWRFVRSGFAERRGIAVLECST